MSRRRSFPSVAAWPIVFLALSFAFDRTAPALATGVPASLTVDPASIRQRNKETTPVTATVTLEIPSPTFFVCELRSAEPRKISFATIIFRKGDMTGHGQGFVYWKSILKDARIRVTAFSTDAPDRQLSFTVLLRPKEAEETDSPHTANAQ